MEMLDEELVKEFEILEQSRRLRNERLSNFSEKERLKVLKQTYSEANKLAKALELKRYEVDDGR